MMVILGIFAFCVSIPLVVTHNTVDNRYLISNALELITVCVPPALPAVLACGIVFAMNRLQK